MRLTGVVEEERVVRLVVLDQPMHSAEDVGLGRLAHGVLLVVGQKHHVFTGITKVLIQIGRHVLHIVDAPAQLALLVEIVDSDQKRLPLSGARGILEVVALGRAMSERDGGGRGRRRATVMAVAAIGVRWGRALVLRRTAGRRTAVPRVRRRGLSRYQRKFLHHLP